MPDLCLDITGLSRSFGQLQALAGVDLAVAEGELVGLVGPDGAGKTTCLRCLAGVLDPQAGHGEILGRPFPREIEAVKARLGYMPQRFGLYPDLSVAENLGFYAEIHRLPKPRRAGRMAELLAFVNLAKFRDRQAGRLSGGMKQKLGLACALVHRPRLLLLDEPTNGVDPVSLRDFWALLTGLLAEGVAVAVATTYLDEAERCHRVAFLSQGRTLRTDAPGQLRAAVPGRLIELETPSQDQARLVLADLYQVAWVNRFGLGLHVLVKEGVDPGVPANSLAQAGVEVTGWREIEPSLEDAFIHHLGAEGARGWV
jgi:ABC-2 type transport system ATP-binding protein